MKNNNNLDALDKERQRFLEASSLMAMREAARHPEDFKKCNFIPVTEEIKKIFRDNKEEAYMEMDPAPHIYDAFLKPVKRINVDGKEIDIPKDAQSIPGKKGGLSQLPADIVFANTIPLKHMAIMPKVYKEDKYIDYYIIHFHDDDVRNANIFKMLSGEADEASIGWIQHILDGTIFNVKGWIKYYVEIVLDAKHDNIALNKMHYYESSESLKGRMDEMHNNPMFWFPKLAEEVQVNFEVLAAWYTLQQCILHDELKEFVKKARIEKPSIKKPTERSMRNKKYVQRYVIQLQRLFNEYDINDIDNSKGPRKYKKALWHVAGHWRHYKDGKRVFIQGYWKGSQRNSGDPNKMHFPIEISLDNFKDVLGGTE